LDEDDVEGRIDFWNSVDKKRVFPNILREDFEIFTNHILPVFIDK